MIHISMNWSHIIIRVCIFLGITSAEKYVYSAICNGEKEPHVKETC